MSPDKVLSFLKQNPVLAGINGILGVLFLSLVLSGGSGVAKTEMPGLSSESPPVNLESPGVPGLESPLYRTPVFHADRHPAQKPEAPRVAAAEIPFRLELTGVLKVSEEIGWAFLKIAGTPENRQVAIGEEIDGWRLEELGDNQATLSRNGQSRTVSMDNPLSGNPQNMALGQADQGDRPRTRKRK